MLKRVLSEHRIRQSELAAHLGITEPAVSAKLKGRRPWSLVEARSVADFINGFTGREYTVDELFFAEEEGAA